MSSTALSPLCGKYRFQNQLDGPTATPNGQPKRLIYAAYFLDKPINGSVHGSLDKVLKIQVQN